MPPAKPALKSVKVLQNKQQLCSLRYSRCGKLLAGGTFEGTILRWDAESLTEMPPIKGHNGWVQSLAFHPDGKRLFSADSWGRITCWNYLDPMSQPIWSVADAHNGWIHSIANSPDGKALASVGRDKILRLTSAENGAAMHTSITADDAFAVAFHPSGKFVVTGDLKGLIQVWDAATGKVARTFDAAAMYLKDRIQDVGGVRCLTFDEKGETLIAGGSKPKSGGFVEGSLQILFFDWSTGKLKHSIVGTAATEGYVQDLHWHSEGYVMAVHSGQPGNGKVFFQRPAEAQPWLTQAGMTNAHALTLHPAGKRLAVSGTNANSAGNGRPSGKDYPGNFSPVHVFEMPE
jgi:WD40 repeat protein